MAHLGDIKIALDYQVQKQGPLDARLKKKTKAELIDINSWPHEGNVVYVYKTMLVGIEDTGEVYKLVDPLKMFESDYSGWELLGSNGEGITIDSELDTTSKNPVENQAIANELNEIRHEIDSKLDYEVVEEIVTPEGELDLSGYATTKWVQEQLDEIRNAMLQELE